MTWVSAMTVAVYNVSNRPQIQMLQLLETVLHQHLLRLDELTSRVLGFFVPDRGWFIREARHLERLHRRFIILCVGTGHTVMLQADDLLVLVNACEEALGELGRCSC